MYVTPHIFFGGNCIQAMEHYEKAFGVKVAAIVRYNDTPPQEGFAAIPGSENLISHASLEFERGQIYFCDFPPGESPVIGNNVGITVEFESSEKVQAAFKVLAEGGSVDMEPQKTFWCGCFCSVTDKFGIGWHIATSE